MSMPGPPPGADAGSDHHAVNVDNHGATSTISNATAPDKNGFTLQKSFAKTLPMPKSSHGWYEEGSTVVGDFFGFLGMIPCCIFCPNPMRTVEQGQVGLIQKFGKCYRIVDPGLYKINLITETLRSVDIKINVEDIPRQYVMTKDNVNITIDSVLYWHIVDPYCASFLVADVRTALIERTQTTLRHIVGQRTLQDAIENRDTIALEIKKIVEEPCKNWGVSVEAILVKDLQFSKELLETLSAAAKQKRVGESKIIAAQAEVESARLMREASDILNTPAAMQIRYLETLQTMARTSGAKVIFMPLDGDSAALKNATPADLEKSKKAGSTGKGAEQKFVNAQVLQEL